MSAMNACALFARFRLRTNCAGWNSWRHSFDWLSLSKASQPAKPENTIRLRRLTLPDAATKLIWLALRNITADWGRAVKDWKEAMNQFALLYEDRFTRITT